jgi:protease-4
MTLRKGRLFLLLFLGFVVLVVIAGQLVRRIPDHTVLELQVSGSVAEEDWPDLAARFYEGEVTIFRQWVEALDRAQRDDRVAGVSLEISSVGMGFAKIQELRAKLAMFTAGGKFCTAYLEEGDNLSYYLASACPEVYLTPTSLLDLRGMMAHTTFLRGTLDKLGIYPDLYHIAEYKTARNVFTEKKYTSAHREVVEALVSGWQAQMVAGIAERRRLDPALVEELVREGPYLAAEAVEKKLVDQLLYYDEYRKLLKEKAGGEELKTLGLTSYFEGADFPRGPKIALVHATGTILTGKSGYDPFMGRHLGSDTIAAALREARQDKSIQAIVFRVDSPGGSAVASEIIRREVVLAKKQKPVVVSMSDVAGSGGYWISMSANKIIADPGTITGSIGVVYGKMNIRGLYEKLGMTKDYVALTPNATLTYPFENFTPAQRQTVLRFMRNIYDNFLQGVSEGRGLKVEEVDRMGKGRVWLGAEAKERRLVDELGGLERAVAEAKVLAGIAADQQVQFVIYPRPKTTWEKLQESMEEHGVRTLPIRSWLEGSQALWGREPAWVMMPFEVKPR